MYDSLSEQEHASTLSKEGADITQLLLCRKRQMGLLKGAFSFQTAIVIMKCCFCRVFSRSFSFDRYSVNRRTSGCEKMGGLFWFMPTTPNPITPNTHYTEIKVPYIPNAHYTEFGIMNTKDGHYTEKEILFKPNAH